jgi:large subunit ribosomal protein L21
MKITSLGWATCTANLSRTISMTYAIIETGGKQMRVEPGRFYEIELLPVEEDSNYTVDKVLLIHNDQNITIGQPYVEGATVEGTVLKHWRAKKVLVYKMQPKKKTRKKRGHRQEMTRFMINSISVNGNVIATAAAQETDNSAE